jgi:membrane protease YdiL (CAAX protease family)
MGLSVAIVIYVIAVIMPKFVLDGIVAKVLTTQGLEVGLSIVAIAIFGKGRFRDYGFRLPQAGYFSAEGLARLLWPILGALAVGAVASLSVMISGGGGNPLVKQLSFPQIILFVWIFSSIIEEVFTRGFLQSHLAGGLPAERLPIIGVSRATLISALFFAAMHLSLIAIGVDVASIFVTLAFTFCLGLLCGHQREKSGSLLPAIGLHMLGNIGGFIGGILYLLFTVLTSGTPPGP